MALRRPVLTRRPPAAQAPADGASPMLSRRLARYVPVPAAYAVFQSLLGVLPASLSGDAARYALAGTAGVATGLLVWLAVQLRRGRDEAAGPPPAADGAAGAGAAGPVIPGPARPGEPFPRLAAGAREAVLRARSVCDDPALGPLTGWPHFLEEGEAGHPPTAIGTAYGLHLALALGPDDGRFDQPALVETLWRLRLPDGGWAARTGTGVSRPEVTALVLGALSRAGAHRPRLDEAVEVLEGLLAPGADPEGEDRTYVIGAAIRGLLRAAPGSPLLPELRDRLTRGALRDPARDGLACWGYSLEGDAGPLRPDRPSPVHTAQAVLALARATAVLGPERRSRQAMEQGREWLVRHGEFAHQTEHLRRFAAGRPTDHTFVRHFTAGWVARALMAVPAPPEDPALRRAAEACLRSAVARVRVEQRGGVWEWGDDREHRPIWMTYQGISVLIAHAHRSYTTP
ncbi:hypothetical protein [Streptomyces aidingensis]|uniref:Prenyltransferase and squalene oxidase repeat-containing protein n=1 Tax=Streptomyces aidingensis TaxID=910347 RepID=A0A1I1SSG2_9ACTN|nr:hypothetical protein [Streptomyces aidingensis]SFD49262.1 hypothetical protein SAMN05421773_11716 [Streptomyces aidingensis]